MRSQSIWTITIFGLVLTGAVAAWQLRAPIRSGLTYVHQQVAGTSELRFAVVGDNHGDNPVYREILKRLRSEKYDFLLNLADTSEYGTADEFAAVQALESTLPFPVYHTVGNHDIKTDPTRQAFQTAFGGPNTAVTRGQVRLLIIDNADRKVGFSNTTSAWLKTELARQPDATYLLAYHRPFGLPLANVAGDDETRASRASNERLREIIRPYHVAYVFTAHLHTYIPYRLGRIPAVVSGGGGDPAQAVLGGPKNNFFHYLEVEIQNGQPRVTLRPVHL